MTDQRSEHDQNPTGPAPQPQPGQAPGAAPAGPAVEPDAAPQPAPAQPQPQMPQQPAPAAPSYQPPFPQQPGRPYGGMPPQQLGQAPVPPYGAPQPPYGGPAWQQPAPGPAGYPSSPAPLVQLTGGLKFAWLAVGVLLSLGGVLVAWLANFDRAPELKREIIKWAAIGFAIRCVLSILSTVFLYSSLGLLGGTSMGSSSFMW